MRLRLLTALAILTTTPTLARADDVIVVPFGAEGGETPALARQLAAATVEVLEIDPATSAQLARASRGDILTLAACPEAAPSCIGQLAANLDADRAITGVVSTDGARIEIAIQEVRRDGSVATHAIDLGDAPAGQRIARYRDELRRALGGAPPGPADAAVTPAPALAPAAPPPAPPGMTRAPPGATGQPIDRPGSSAVRPHTWAVIGVAAIGLGLGSAFLVKADRTEKAIMDAPTRTADDLRALRALEDRGDTEKTTGAALLAVAGAAAIAGGVLLAWDLSRERSGAVAIAPGAGGGVELSIAGRF